MIRTRREMDSDSWCVLHERAVENGCSGFGLDACARHWVIRSHPHLVFEELHRCSCGWEDWVRENISGCPVCGARNESPDFRDYAVKDAKGAVLAVVDSLAEANAIDGRGTCERVRG